MKLYKSFMFSALAAVAALATSCSDEGYWDGYTPESPEYSFAQATNSYKYLPTDDIPTSYELKVYRNNNNGEVALPLVVDYAGDVFSTKDTIVFADGSNEAICTVGVNNPVIGKTESITIAIDTTAQAYKVSPTGNISVTLSLSLDYTWVAAGSCIMTATTPMFDFEEAKGNVQIQKAKEYEGNLYRLVAPYYTLGASSDPTCHIKFLLDENYEPVALTPTFQDTGAPCTDGGNWTIYYSTAGNYGESFTREGTVFTINAVWAYGDADMGYSLGYYATEVFDWNDGCPSAL